MAYVKKIILIPIFMIIVNLFGDEKIFSKIFTKYEEIKTYESEFLQQNYYEEMGLTNKYEGKLYYNSDKLILKYSNPNGQFLLISQLEIKMFDPESNQLLISEISEDFNMVKPISILQKYIKISEISTSENENNYILKLLPKNDELTKIDIIVNKKTLLIKEMSYFTDDDFVKYQFKNEKINKNFQEGIFNFNLPENSQIIRR